MGILLCGACQFAAAFWALRYFGAIPATAKSLNQCHGVYHAPAENVYGGDFVRERGGLSGCHLQIASYAPLVARVGKRQIFLRCDAGLVLNLSFVLENAQGCYVVFNLLKAGQHGLAIVGDRLIVSSDGLV